MITQTALVALSIFIFCTVILLGCAKNSPGCWEPVGMNPVTGYAAAFNTCTGDYSVQMPSSSTTTTTLPRSSGLGA